MRAFVAPSSNGKRADSDSVNQGSNPCGASTFPPKNKRLASAGDLSRGGITAFLALGICHGPDARLAGAALSETMGRGRRADAAKPASGTAREPLPWMRRLRDGFGSKHYVSGSGSENPVGSIRQHGLEKNRWARLDRIQPPPYMRLHRGNAARCGFFCPGRQQAWTARPPVEIGDTPSSIAT